MSNAGRVAACGALAVVVGALGGWVWAGDRGEPHVSQPSTPSARVGQIAFQNAPQAATQDQEVPSGVLRDGRTFGPLVESSKDGSEVVPDLVAVYGDHGQLGYADSSLALDYGKAKDPADAVAKMREAREAMARGEMVRAVVPVYGPDGTTQIDTFSIRWAVPANVAAK